jgi:hypothetical protein
MKFPTWFKITWWLLIICFLGFISYQRYDSIVNGTTTGADVAIFIILIVLLVSPLFQEVNFMGFGVKQQIESLKNDIKKDITNLNSQIKNVVYIYPQKPPTDAEIKDLEETNKPILEKNLAERGVSPELKTRAIAKDYLSELIKELFNIRFNIEREIKRIAQTFRLEQGEEKQIIPANRLSSIIANQGIIDREVAELVREIYNICSAGLHGEDISDASLEFVRDTSPDIIAYLKSIDVSETAKG